MMDDPLARWRREIPIEAEVAAMRLRGLSFLCAAWAEYRGHVGDPGPAGEGDVMATFEWALRAIAETLTPPDPEAMPDPNGHGPLHVVRPEPVA